MSESQSGAGKLAAWMRLQVGFLPSLVLLSGAAIILADSHNDGRYQSAEHGKEVQRTVDGVQAVVTEVQKAQAVSAEKIENIETTVEELKEGQESIEAKLDRLIERSSGKP